MPRPTRVTVVSVFILLGAWPQQVLRGCCGPDRRQTGRCWGEGSGPALLSQARGLDGPGGAGELGVGLFLACANLPSGAELTLMKWAVLRLALIS